MFYFRGASDKASVEQAYATLDSQLQTLPLEQYQHQAPAPAPTQVESSYHSAAGVNHHVTTETTTQQLGGSTVLTKVRREEVFQSGRSPALSPYPGQQQRGVQRPVQQSVQPPAQHPVDPEQTMFKVPQVSSAPKPGVWQPSGAPQVKSFKVEAPEGVSVEHHPDQSVTMTLGVGGQPWQNQENVQPEPAPQHYQPPPQQPLFNPHKFTPTTGGEAYRPAAPLSQYQPEQAPPSEPTYDHYYSYDTQDGGGGEMMTEEEHDMLKKVMYSRIALEGGSESESGADSPTAWFRSKSKSQAEVNLSSW